MKIISVALNSLKLADFMDFIDIILAYAKKDGGLMELCRTILEALEEAYQRMEAIYARHRKNIITPEIADKDSKRDQQYAYMRRIVDAERRSLNQANVKAAEELWYVIEDYGRMDNLSYNSQSTKLKSLCADMIQEHLAAVETLRLRDSIDLLNQLNNEFQELYIQRIESVMDHEDGEMAAARKRTTQLYTDLRIIVCGLYLWRYKAELTPFVNFANATIPRFRILAGQTGTKPETAPDDETPEETTPGGDNNNGNTGGENGGNQQPGTGSEGSENNPSTPGTPSNPSNPNNPDPDDDPDALKPGDGGDDPDL